jgi:hypothetical protein
MVVDNSAVAQLPKSMNFYAFDLYIIAKESNGRTAMDDLKEAM